MIKALRGTQDILPGAAEKWQFLETRIRRLCRQYGFGEIRTPHFEQTELFQRGIGETTDVVSKEMYTFLDRGNRSLTLRPENTAAAVRAYLEHKEYADQGVTKWYYMGSMFRYDRPQAGRFREFHQFGIEILGTPLPQADAECIAMAVQLFTELGLQDLTVYINSVGCPVCRPRYRQALLDYLQQYRGELCEDCVARMEKNPLRVLDCKQEHCHAVALGAPRLTAHLCEGCATHYQAVRALLAAAGIAVTEDPRLVRGLDYYTKTAFEIQYAPLGAQSAICGGGRYDGLVEEIGGISVPGIGFAVGLERLLLALESQQLLPVQDTAADVAIAVQTEAANEVAFALGQQLRQAGRSVDTDLLQRSMKSRLKQAAKSGVKYVIIMGETELTEGTVTLRDMQSHAQETVPQAALTDVLATKLDGRG